MAVTVKLKQTEVNARFKELNGCAQSGTVTYSLEDFYKIYVFEKAFKEFMEWTQREYYVYCQGRTSSANKSVKGHASSNHLDCLGCDTYFKDTTWNKERFLKYAKKWKEIAKANGFVGEIGWYPDYTCNGCKGMIHIGGFVDYSKTFFYWVTQNGKQVNKPYGEIK